MDNSNFKLGISENVLIAFAFAFAFAVTICAIAFSSAIHSIRESKTAIACVKSEGDWVEVAHSRMGCKNDG